VLGHQYVPVDAKLVLFPSFLQDVQEALLDAVVVEQGPTLIATAGDEVRAARVVVALEPYGHESRVGESRVRFCYGGHR